MLLAYPTRKFVLFFLPIKRVFWVKRETRVNRYFQKTFVGLNHITNQNNCINQIFLLCVFHYIMKLRHLVTQGGFEPATSGPLPSVQTNFHPWQTRTSLLQSLENNSMIMVYVHLTHYFFYSLCSRDGARTRDLLRDRQAL